MCEIVVHRPKRAICPGCGDVMVKVYRQDEEGNWSCGWECANCQPSAEKIAEIEEGVKAMAKCGGGKKRKGGKK